MKYTLVTKAGAVYTFYFREVADCYAQAYGGVVFTDEILVDTVTA
jgi:hypothetical protein